MGPNKNSEPARELDRVVKEIVATRFFEIPADTVLKYGQE
jgi:hypothetical protein